MVPDDHLENITECPDCASQNIVHGMMRDQIICRDCGLIFEPLAPAAAVKPVPAKKGKAKKPAKKAKKKAKPSKKKKRK
jgi:transcription initiation factor TFIIIB Brf1 subunit/transcription initiation factor TFIIB